MSIILRCGKVVPAAAAWRPPRRQDQSRHWRVPILAAAFDRRVQASRSGDRMTIYVDHTHLGRHVTGLERITLELFSPAALAPLDVVPVTAHGTRRMVTTQTFGLPMRLAATSSILLCPG